MVIIIPLFYFRIKICNWMPIPSVNCAFVLDDYRFRVRGSPSHNHSLLFFFTFVWLKKKFVTFRHSIHFGPLWPIQFSSVYFSPIWYIWSTLVQLDPFDPIWSISMYFLKNEKRKVWVESIINYLSNINCNYMIIFYYHNNLLKRMRI